jgi:Methane oxygenase PmoA
MSWGKTLVAAATMMAAVGALGAGAGSPAGQVRIEKAADHVSVTIDGKPFTTLRADKAAQKLYLHPVLTASGKRVTRGFPMEPAPGESTDHPHQRGVWIGAEHVNDADFWENEPSDHNPRAGVVTLTSVSDIHEGPGEGAFTLTADWVPPGPGSKPLVAETRTMTFRALTPETRAIDIDLRLRAQSQVVFADHHDALLGLRLATPFEVAHGGRLLNAEGQTEWEKLRGARSAWVDSLATLDGEGVGVAVMDAPTNFRFPTSWHVREYALVFASPFALRDYDKSAPDGALTLKPGQELKLRYRILIHPASTDVTAAFKEFSGR